MSLALTGRIEDAKNKKINIIVITIQPIASIAKGVVEDIGKKERQKDKNETHYE
ncbi:MAG: hypothetical protein M9896_19845 [Candidatus Promineofilum sp.]|uniref:hypothetical protein n=1 Tax=Promineifilum sp. TaxID=2664178 RepID=UPI002411C315|nr:hypothetical protein [Promineifilum sp.]